MTSPPSGGKARNISLSELSFSAGASSSACYHEYIEKYQSFTRLLVPLGHLFLQRREYRRHGKDYFNLRVMSSIIG